MLSVPIGCRVFMDTNVLLYAVTEHPGYGKWADALLDRIRSNEIEGTKANCEFRIANCRLSDGQTGA
jgi:hypothetical protein